nr:putative deoxyuridine 5'-triphosphate nucleotidohydrolase [Micropterus salmoides ranavirus]
MSLLLYTKLSKDASDLTKGSELAAGYDLCSAHNMCIPPGKNGLVMTDLAISVPDGTYGRIAPRSGLAVKHRIGVGAGVVDADYRGNVGIVLFNFGQEDFLVRKGDRVAQLICEKIEYPVCVRVRELTETARAEAGFGSTGV